LNGGVGGSDGRIAAVPAMSLGIPRRMKSMVLAILFVIVFHFPISPAGPTIIFPRAKCLVCWRVAHMIDALVVAAMFAFAYSLMVASGVIISATRSTRSLHLAPKHAHKKLCVNVRSTTTRRRWKEPGTTAFLFNRLCRSFTVVNEAFSIASASSFSSSILEAVASTIIYGDSPFIAAAAL